MKKIKKIVDKIMEWVMLFGIVLMFGILFFAPMLMSFYYEILCADLALIAIPLFYAIESYDPKK
ncbi:MAG: hypothetical protein ACI4XH_03760 [Acutalibacteraceae bacterium]